LTEAIILYSDGTDIYRRRLSAGTWEAAAKWTNSLDSISGLATHYIDDWNVIVTGVASTTLKAGVWSCLLGDGYSAAADTWTALAEIMLAASDSSVTYKFPSIDLPDVYRAFFVEAYTGTESYSRPYYSRMVSGSDFVNNLWSEPVPFNLASSYGLAIVRDTLTGESFVWLTRPDGVWRASLTAKTVDVTADVLRVSTKVGQNSGYITVVLRNDDGRFGNIGVAGDTYEAIKIGSELRFSPGYYTTSGTEISVGPFFWIRSWEYTSFGGRAEFVLHAIDGWGLLAEWKARRQYSWASGDKSIYKLVELILGKVGLKFGALGNASTAVTTLKPSFTIYPGASGKNTILRLLATVEDIIFMRGVNCYLKNPQPADATDYSYGWLV